MTIQEHASGAVPKAGAQEQALLTAGQVQVRLLRHDGRVELLAAVDAPTDRQPGDLVWVDMVAPDLPTLDAVTEQLGFAMDLHPLVREDVFDAHRRAKIDRYDDHIFLDLVDIVAMPSDAVPEQVSSRRHAIELDGGEVLVLGLVSAIVFRDRVITVRSRDDTLDVGRIPALWAAASPKRRKGPGLLIHALLDEVVDRIVAVAELLDGDADELEQQVIDRGVPRSEIQARAFTLRKATSLVRRVAMPTREVVSQVLRRDGSGFVDTHVCDATVPYLHDVSDHIVRVSESLDGLRDELTSVLELNMSLQDAELNEVMKKLSAWAAIIAVPTAVTGYFGQNVPYPGFSTSLGFWMSVVLIVGGAMSLWFWFRRLAWL